MKRQQVAVITGGGGDLARAICGELEAHLVEVLAPSRQELDVTQENEVVEFARRLGDLDLLIANAGKINDRLLGRHSEADWDELLEVNLNGAARVARLLGKKLKRGGSLILVGSYSAFHPPAGQVAYAAAKAGLLGLNHSLAKEWGRRGVRCNLLLPGLMETKMTAGLSAEAKQAALERHHLGQFNSPEAVAKFVRFLHFEMPATSGQVFNLDSRTLV